MNPNVSIIIPCFNAEQFLEEAVISCVNQSYNNIIEIILVDNNSSDNTFEIANEISRKDNRILVIQEKEKGACATRNAGLKIVKGEWIQFLDADDVLLSNKIESQVAFINQSKLNNIGVVFGAYYQNDKPRLLLDKGSPFWGLLAGGLHCGGTPSNLWKREACMVVEGFNPQKSSSQETDLIFRIFKEGYTAIVHNEPLTRFIDRHNPDKISNQNIEKKLYNFFNLRREIILFILSQSPDFFNKNVKNSIELYYVLLNRIMGIEPESETDLNNRIDFLAFIHKTVFCPFWLIGTPKFKFRIQYFYFRLVKNPFFAKIDRMLYRLDIVLKNKK
jgi:glycosyltransferase involved in cell wall biosynthesis